MGRRTVGLTDPPLIVFKSFIVPMINFETLNERGKQLFSQNKYQEAIEVFTQAIPHLQTENQRETLYNNRGLAHIKLNHWEDGEADATEALISIGTNRKNKKGKRVPRPTALNKLTDCGALRKKTTFSESLKLTTIKM